MNHEVLGVIPYAVNFTLVVAALVYFTRKPFERFLYQRHEHIRDAVEAAKKDQVEVVARLARVDAALKNFKEDAESIWSQERLDATQEAASIAERSRQELARADFDAQRIIENESREREQEMRGEFVAMIAAEAESKLRKNLKREDHSGLIKRASGHIEIGV